MTYHVCHDGQWSRAPGEKRCTCPPATPLEGAASGLVRQRDEDKDGKILCWPPQNTQASCSFPQMYSDQLKEKFGLVKLVQLIWLGV